MAAPASKTIEELNGKWVLNKTFSDTTDTVLALQGVSYLTRSAIRLASVSYDLNQYTGPSEASDLAGTEVTYLESVQTASGLKGSKDTRCLDNQPREVTDWLFGTVTSHSRWATQEDISDEFLKEGWLDEAGDKTLILTASENKDKGWTATQINGFQTINGERRYCARSVVEKNGKRAQVRLVFDYVS